MTDHPTGPAPGPRGLRHVRRHRTTGRRLHPQPAADRPAAPTGPAATASAAAPDPLAAPDSPAAPGPAPAVTTGTRTAALRRTAAPIGVLAAVTAAFALVGVVDPNEPGHYPVCPFLRWTGLLCPGCGGLRGAHALAHGDLARAAGANLLLVAGCVLFAAVWTVWLTRAARGRPGPSATLRARHWWALGTLVALFTVVRNLPFGAALAP